MALSFDRFYVQASRLLYLILLIMDLKGSELGSTI
jgi:hypothetical protein